MDDKKRTRKNDQYNTRQNALSPYFRQRENTKMKNKKDSSGKDIQDDEMSDQLPVVETRT